MFTDDEQKRRIIAGRIVLPVAGSAIVPPAGIQPCGISGSDLPD
jgi:hypothetical protein